MADQFKNRSESDELQRSVLLFNGLLEQKHGGKPSRSPGDHLAEDRASIFCKTRTVMAATENGFEISTRFRQFMVEPFCCPIFFLHDSKSNSLVLQYPEQMESLRYSEFFVIEFVVVRVIEVVIEIPVVEVVVEIVIEVVSVVEVVVKIISVIEVVIEIVSIVEVIIEIVIHDNFRLPTKSVAVDFRQTLRGRLRAGKIMCGDQHQQYLSVFKLRHEIGHFRQK